jgi:hypothetical protein
MTKRKENLRVWWIPQVPMRPFYVPVRSVKEAKLILNTLADYDLFQYDTNVKLDYTSAGGLQIQEGEEWIEWSNEEGDEIDEVMHEEGY